MTRMMLFAAGAHEAGKRVAVPTANSARKFDWFIQSPFTFDAS
jgi:hypothetical protein